MLFIDPILINTLGGAMVLCSHHPITPHLVISTPATPILYILYVPHRG